MGETVEEFAQRIHREHPRMAGEASEAYAQRLRLTTGYVDHRLEDFAANAAVFGGVVAVGAVRTVAEYFRDLFSTMFSRGASTDAMARTDEALAVADLLMLAIAADGRVTDEELATLRGFHTRAGLEDDADAALAAFFARIPTTGDLQAVERAARAGVPRVSPAMRREVYRLVYLLDRDGPGKAPSGVYREAATDGTSRCDRIAALLGIPDEVRRTIEQSPDEPQAG